jgi:sec-independent protein translocase protein TatB
MFDLGFSEIAVVAVVALVVLGPERLPKVARTAGHLFGRLQRYVSGVKADIAREMEASELSKIKQEVETAARSFESSVKEQAASFESEARAIEQDTQKALSDKPVEPAPSSSPAAPTVSAPTKSQAEILANEDAAFENMAPRATAPAPAPASAPAPVPSRSNNGQSSFDFGIEPSRKRNKVAS